MKKSYLGLLFAIVMCLICFSACNNGGDLDTDIPTSAETDIKTDTTTQTPSEESTVISTEAADTPASTEPPTEAHVCSFGEWQTVKEATCVESGMRERVCECGEKLTYVIQALGHTVAIDAAVAPTCTETGLTEGKYCSVCGDTLVEQKVAAALGHVEIVHEAKPSTCTEIGWKAYVTCERCDYSTYEELELAEHDHKELGEACSVCGAIKFSTGLSFISNGDGTCSVAKGTCEHSEQLYIPAISPSGDAVTSIADEAFYKCSDIVSVTIPDSVTVIGHSAFRECTALESIVISESINDIGDEAFEFCTKLESVTIMGDVESIGGWAFSFCSSLRELRISGAIESVGLNAFYNCEALENVYVTDIASWCATDFMGDQANPLYNADNLYWNEDLVEYLVIPHGITRIGKQAFYGFKAIKGVKIPASVTSIGEEAFSTCVNLAEITVDASNTVYKTVGNNLYSKDGKTLVQYALGQSNEHFDIPYGVEFICIGAFAFSENLATVSIPNSVKEINENAFVNCWNINNVVIPDSVVYIGPSAFARCLSLTNLTIGRGVKVIDDDGFHNCLFIRHLTIPNNVEYIGRYAFAYMGYLSSVVIEDAAPGADSTMTIGEYAFFNSNSLSDLTLGSSVANIGRWAFGASNNLQNVTVHDNIKSVGIDVFDVTENLNYSEWGNACYVGNSDNPYLVLFGVKDKDADTVEIHTDTRIIAEEAFAYMNNLSEIYIPSNVVMIGPAVFNECTSLKSITVDEDNTAYKSINDALYSIDGKLLLGYASGKADSIFAVPDGVERIGNKAFSHAKHLERVILPDSVEEIGKSAFYFCENLKEINLTDNIGVIAYEAFAFCKKLVSMNISDKVTRIEDRTFYSCENLETITIGSGITHFGDYALDGCYKLTTVDYNGTVEQWCAINKGYGFDRDMKNCTIYCTDGEISE